MALRSRYQTINLHLHLSTLHRELSTVQLNLYLLSLRSSPVTCVYCDYYSDWEMAASDFYTRCE